MKCVCVCFVHHSAEDESIHVEETRCCLAAINIIVISNSYCQYF